MGMLFRWHAAALALALGIAGGASAAPAAPTRPTARPPTTTPRPGTTAPGAPTAPMERTLVNPNSVAVFPFEKAPESKNPPPMLGEWIAGQIRAGLDRKSTRLN